MEFKHNSKASFKDKAVASIPEKVEVKDEETRGPLPKVPLLLGKVRPSFLKTMEDYLLANYGFSVGMYKERGLSHLDLLGEGSKLTKLLPLIR